MRALRSGRSSFQASVIVGPAIGGLLFALHSELVYATAAGAVGRRARRDTAAPRGPRRRRAARRPISQSVLGGVRLVRRTPVLLGAISLDLFAVLFGGAVALLPVFAKDVLDVGPAGLGVLRAAPAVGALCSAIVLTRRPVRRHAGRTLLTVVGLYGVSIVVFGLSQTMWLSLLALAVGGGGRHGERRPAADDPAARHAGRAARARQRGRDGVHQRLERARCVRVGRRRGARRRGARGRDRRRADGRDRRRLVRGSSRRSRASTASTSCGPRRRPRSAASRGELPAGLRRLSAGPSRSRPAAPRFRIDASTSSIGCSAGSGLRPGAAPSRPGRGSPGSRSRRPVRPSRATCAALRSPSCAGGVGLGDVVDPGAAAADVLLGRLDHRQAGDPAQRHRRRERQAAGRGGDGRSPASRP